MRHFFCVYFVTQIDLYLCFVIEAVQVSMLKSRAINHNMITKRFFCLNIAFVIFTVGFLVIMLQNQLWIVTMLMEGTEEGSVLTMSLI